MTTIENEIQKAAEYLQKNRLIAFPTETVYGLGGNALSDEAVAGIYAAKGRPQFNPLIVHVPSIEYASRFVIMNKKAQKLAAAFWPGPLTLVLPRSKNCPLSLLVSAGMDTVAVRVPAHPVARALLAASDMPLAAPSANRSGRISPTDAAHVWEELGERVAMVLDGGPCDVGIESTVIDLTRDIPVLLRPGSLSLKQLSAVIGSINMVAEDAAITAPGMLASHYAPSCSVRLNATTVTKDEALLAFGKAVPMGAALTENLSPDGNLHEAAANLFRMLRKLDQSGIKRIAVMTIPEEGEHNTLGIAINDRLKRAAAPKLPNGA